MKYNIKGEPETIFPNFFDIKREEEHIKKG